MRLNEFPTADAQHAQQKPAADFKAGSTISTAFQHVTLGYAYVATTKLEQALEQKRNIGDTHGQIMLLTALTRMMVEQDNLSSARDYIETAHDLNPRDPRTLRAYGVVLYKQRHDMRGDRMMEDSLKYTPEDRPDIKDYTQRIWAQLRAEDALTDSADPKTLKALKKAQKSEPRWPTPGG